jgi:dTDP-4-amino-4,6-dideoxygalactose transaminase
MAVVYNSVKEKANKYKKEIIRKTSKIIKTGIFLNGPENKKLVQNLKKYFGRGFITPTASGHDAIVIALASIGIKEKNEVIFPVNAYPTVFPIAQTGAKLVPIDVDKNGLINPEEVRRKINKKTKAIIVVHLYGLIADTKAIKKIIGKKKIALVEDAAQAFGIKPTANIACFSFYPTKNLGTLGDGGALWTKNKKLHKYFQKAVSYGEGERYESQFAAGHSRLPEIQAGILHIYMKNIKRELMLRKRVYKLYLKLLSLHAPSRFKQSAPHLFVINVKNRNKLKNFLSKRGIETDIHYPHPIHLVHAFKYLKLKRGTFPIAEKLAKNILSLPFHPYLTKKQVTFVVKSIKDFYE